MVEICLTRIFSIVLWYHFGFLAVSTALLGFAASGVWPRSSQERGRRAGRLADRAQRCLRGARDRALAVAHDRVVVRRLLDRAGADDRRALRVRALGHAAVLLPRARRVAHAGGLPGPVGPLYAYDLCGSALGCCASVWVLSLGFSAQAVVLVGATLVGLGALLFAGRAFAAWPIALLGIAVPAGFLLGSDPQAAFPLLAPKSKPYHEVEKFDEIMAAAPEADVAAWRAAARGRQDARGRAADRPEGAGGALRPERQGR
jgi:hypothetical protein